MDKKGTSNRRRRNSIGCSLPIQQHGATYTYIIKAMCVPWMLKPFCSSLWLDILTPPLREQTDHKTEKVREERGGTCTYKVWVMRTCRPQTAIMTKRVAVGRGIGEVVNAI